MRLYDRKAGENAMSTFSSVVDWPEELATDKTGPDGRFALDITPGSYLLVAQGERRYRFHANIVTDEWALPVEVKNKAIELQLDGKNAISSIDIRR